ncbi:THO complex subunit 6 [Eumeta japonica]|uniref:THO complex subunit 6 n=1 Tax=Eumeta variegata TaxID=151549 RepID=A0A4C1VP86_EUMVA|nr:THO complex subunit 6 [Eumeta japonica]
MLDKNLYNTVLCQTFSPCGKYLIAGSIYGQLAVFDLDRVLNPILELFSAEYNKPKYIHELENEVQICSLLTSQKFLIVGTIGEITGWDWKSLVSNKFNKPSWIIKVPFKKSGLELWDVNSMWLSEDESKLYAGCGDNNIYSFSLEGGKLISVYEGHNDYIHCVHGKGKHLISAGEDGFVKLWDSRTPSAQNSMEPHNSKASRPDLGKWVGAVALGDDWIVCGGGPRLSLWHLRSLDAVTVFDIPDHGIHVAQFHEDCVVAGGSAKFLYQLTYSGEVKVELPISATTVYSAILRTTPNKLLTIAGSSPDIDLCTTFNYRDQVLHFRQ